MGTQTVPAKPSELIILAINNLEEKDGSSTQDIIKFISQEYRMKSEEISPRIQEALKRALTYGIIAFKDGRYKLQDIPKHTQVADPAQPQIQSPEAKAPEPEKLKMNMQKPRKRAAPKRVRKRKKPQIKSAVKGTIKASKEMKLRRGAAKKVCRRCQSKAKHFVNE